MRPLKGFLPWLSLAGLLAAAVILTLHRESGLPNPANWSICGAVVGVEGVGGGSGWQEEEEKEREEGGGRKRRRWRGFLIYQI